jgi:uncharacterized protein
VSRSKAMHAGAWSGLWLVLTVVSTLLHRTVWLASADSLPSMAVQTANNISHMVTLPGWVGVLIMGGGWRTGGWAYPLLANASAWAMWVIGAVIILRARRAAVLWRTAPNPGGGLSRILNPAVPAAMGQPDSSRRRFLVNAPIAVAGMGLSGGLVRATVFDPWDLRSARYTVPIADLPPGLEGLRLAQISDTHLGPRIPAAFIESAVAKAMSMQPDIVILTGDYIHAGEVHIEPAADLFRPLLTLGVPVLGVLGNHDWYGNGPRMRRALLNAGIHMIDNSRVYISADDRRLLRAAPAGGLCIAGFGDLTEEGVDLDGALKNVPPGMPRLLLSHNPDAAELRVFRDASRPGPRVDLMISGHTHGGQVRLPFLGTPGIPSRYGQKYAGGLVRGPSFRVLISRGVGMSLLPVRLGVPPEITEITLVRA